MRGNDERLSRMLGGAERGELRRRLRRPFERASAPGVEPVSFRLNSLTPADVALLASLMGRPVRLGAATIEVDVPLVDVALQRAGIAVSLRDALERLDGPIVHTAQARAEAASRWGNLVRGRQDARLADWLATPAGLGLLKRCARQDPHVAAGLCERAESVLGVLPTTGTPRAELAARVLGDAHALDAGEPTATLVLGALRHTDRVVATTDGSIDESPAEGGISAVKPDTATCGRVTSGAAAATERDRHVWARSGVLVNELARPALVLNLPLADGSVWGGTPGDPAHITLRTLVRSPPTLNVHGCIVSICENPNVVAIVADRLGAGALPIVCTEGMPAAAQRTLLLALAAAGATLRYHGDFDWPGLRIAATVMSLCGAAPWRLAGADYRACVGRLIGAPLLGPPASSPWDARLASLMLSHGLAIAEEATIDDLLLDLQADRHC
jgi:uncharacterized protein (TIGR02679 family)